MAKLLGEIALRLLGFKLVYQQPSQKKLVIIFAPHTSNWDFVIGMAAILATGHPIRWFGKKSMFRGPQHRLLKLMGGIPIDRSAQRDTVDYFAQIIREHDEIFLALSPEGTRSYRDYWKSGFYHLALAAKVPLGLGYFDYRAREVGIGKIIELTGDVAADFQTIGEFYTAEQAKDPGKEGPVRIRSPKE